MANAEYILPTGAKLVITSAPYVDASALYKRIIDAARGTQALKDLDVDPANPAGLFKDPAMIMMALDKILAVVASDQVEAAIFKCGERASYEGTKVTKSLLDDPKLGDQAREDFLTLCSRIVEVNCLPFFKRTFSGLKDLAETLRVSPKSSSTPTNP